MAEVLVLTVDGSGNVPPALAIADELMHRGHGVRVLGHARQEPDVRGFGLEFAAYRHAYAWSGQTPRSSTRAALAFARLVSDRGVGRDLAEAHAIRRADVVVVDAMVPGALAHARRLGVPAVALMHTFAAFFLSPQMELAGRLGLLSPRAQYAKAHTLVASDRGLDPAADARSANSYAWTGVAETLPTALARPRPMTSAVPPLVLVSLSSVHIPAQVGMLRRIAVSLSELPVRVLVTTGPTIAPTLVPVFENTLTHQYIPHHQVMPEASLVIGHGGHSTTMRALMHDVPMLILPADPRIDQSMVGRAVARSGAGLCLKRSSTPQAIRAAVVEILSNPGFASAAATVGRRLRETAGAGSAAAHVEALARGDIPQASPGTRGQRPVP